jgi:CRISPR/Cas system-associated exonuclease Cas4 (RecB family)
MDSYKIKNMSKLIKEVNEIIAIRVPPGDRWTLRTDSRKIIHNSLTETLEAYFMETKQKCEYRLAPMDSKLYVIKTVEEEIIPELPKGFNIYGDPI